MERDVALENVSKILRQVSERGLFKNIPPGGSLSSMSPVMSVSDTRTFVG